MSWLKAALAGVAGLTVYSIFHVQEDEDTGKSEVGKALDEWEAKYGRDASVRKLFENDPDNYLVRGKTFEQACKEYDLETALYAKAEKGEFDWESYRDKKLEEDYAYKQAKADRLAGIEPEPVVVPVVKTKKVKHAKTKPVVSQPVATEPVPVVDAKTKRTKQKTALKAMQIKFWECPECDAPVPSHSFICKCGHDIRKF